MVWCRARLAALTLAICWRHRALSAEPSNIIAGPFAAGLTAALGSFLSPAVGAVLVAASTALVAVNAKRLEPAGSHSTVGRS